MVSARWASASVVTRAIPGAASTLLEAAVRESDLVIAPCQPSVMDVWATGSVIETTRKLKRPLRIVINRLPPRQGSVEEVIAALGPAQASLLATRLGNRVAFSQAMLTGRTAPELARRSAASAEIGALRAEVEGLLPA